MLLVVIITWWSVRWIERLTWWNLRNDLTWKTHADSEIVGEGNVNTPNEDTPHAHTDDHPHDEWVLVIAPKNIEQSELSEKTYVGNIYSPYYGQVYPLRDGLIEKLYVDIGDTVKKWAILWKLTAQTYAPELADMQASRQADITIARWWVEAAQYSIDRSIQAKQEYLDAIGGTKSTQSVQDLLAKQGDIVEQEAKGLAEKLQWDLKRLEQSIELQRKLIDNQKEQTASTLTQKEREIALSYDTLQSSIRYAYDILLDVFYDGSYSKNNTQTTNSSLGARNTSTLREFENSFRKTYAQIDLYSTYEWEQLFGYADQMLETVDQAIEVMENTSGGWNYTQTQLLADKQKLIKAKIDETFWLTVVSTALQNRSSALATEKLTAENTIASLELELQKLELQEQQMKTTMSTSQATLQKEFIEEKNNLFAEKWELVAWLQAYDQAISNAEGQMKIAQAELRGAQQALGILQQGWLNNNIVAPFGGTITKRFLTVWNTVSADTPIFDIVDSSEWDDKFVRFEVPEYEYDGLEKNQVVKFLRVQDPVRHYEATIVRIADAIDQESKSILVEAQLKEDYEKVLLGGTVIVMFDQPSRVFLVPIDAVFEDEDKELYIRKVVDDIIVQQIVETWKAIGDQIYITSWLNPWDTIVADISQVEWKETWDSITVVEWFQSSDTDQWLEALWDWHDHEH